MGAWGHGSMGAWERGSNPCSYSYSKKLSAISRQLSVNPPASCSYSYSKRTTTTQRHHAAFRGTGVPPVFAIRMGTGFRPVPHLFYSRLGQPCYVLITGRMPVPHPEPQRGVILPACGQRPKLPSAKHRKPCRGDIRKRRARNLFRPFRAWAVGRHGSRGVAPGYGISPRCG
jgi:hypothetical protein